MSLIVVKVPTCKTKTEIKQKRIQNKNGFDDDGFDDGASPASVYFVSVLASTHLQRNKNETAARRG
jgi:hypothetical protein